MIRARKRAERSVAFYGRGLARLDDAWAGTGDPGAEFADPHHPYTDDLDIFGRGSLFELLSQARTAWGRETLAAWLRAPADVGAVRGRQEGIRELRGDLDLRESLAVAGEEVARGVDPSRLQGWASRETSTLPPGVGAVATALPFLALCALGGWIFLHLGPLPFVAVALITALLALRTRVTVKRLVEGVDGPSDDLSLLSSVLSLFESRPAAAPRLRELRSILESGDGGHPPSHRIAELARLADRLEWGRNAVFAPFAFLLMWDTHHAIAIRRWRSRFGPAVPLWCAAVGEMEALSSFASLSFERPADPFPSFAESGPIYDAEGLGHPLIPEGKCVANDVRLGDELRLIVVSGSNMSGKSTLLRSIGVSAVLAFAGGTVRARRLILSPLATGASIRRNDSLQEGISRFYAEILRLHELITMASGGAPLLFLIDEMLNGTNSHDRRIGSEGVLCGLIERGAIGLVTTHDLALAQIADSLGPRAANVHFEDHIEDGRIAFDYRLRPGVVTKSNALDLMRAVGLDVGGP